MTDTEQKIDALPTRKSHSISDFCPDCNRFTGTDIATNKCGGCMMDILFPQAPSQAKVSKSWWKKLFA